MISTRTLPMLSRYVPRALSLATVRAASTFAPTVQSFATPGPAALFDVGAQISEGATKRRRIIRPRKAILTLSSDAVEQLKSLYSSAPSPTPFLRISIKSKGCAGQSYHLEYVNEPAKHDEVIEQDGVKILVDSKAVFMMVGSTVQWRADGIGERFVFDNPNIKDACGCGESFAF